MDAGSKSGKGFTDDEEEEEEFGRREGSSRKGLGGDGKGGGDHKPSTPRSKHSATEQRRRSKINDRFQLLRNLIPHSDQKRDKASFLLEVIEYVQFLQEKVQKYESGYPGWGQEGTKLMPWKNSQMSSEGITDPCRVIHGDPSSPGFVISGDNDIPIAPTVLMREHAMIDPENVNSGLHNKATTVSAPLQLYGSNGEFAQPQERLVSGSEDATSQSQSQWLRQCSGSGDIPIEQDLTIDDGTINISSAYSHGLFSALSDALQNSGIDMAQASISVQINLGKRAIGESLSAMKDHDDPSSGDQAIGCSQIGNSAAESQQANKRLKPDKS